MTKVDYKKGGGLVPAIIQDAKTGDVLMLGYVNKEALKKTRESGFVHFWSRTRKELWLKGESSGNKLKVKEIFLDCDNDTILIKARCTGTGVCHTGAKNCFFQKI